MVHEWSLAEAIVEYVSRIARERGEMGIESIEIRLGLLQGIDREILDFALKELFKQNGLDVKNIIYSPVEIRLHCRRCGYLWSIDMNEVDEAVREAVHFIPETVYSYFKCPRCGSRDFEIVSGRGVEIGEIKWVRQ